VRAKPLAHQFSFMFFERTGVCFLLGNADLGKHIKNCFALDFKLAGKIVDSNLH
jgi:hypothetical protein